MALVHWFPLAGDILADKGTAKNLATATGTATFASGGKTGPKCLSGGSGLTLKAGGAAEIYNNNALSIAFWIKPLNTNSGIISGNDNMSAPNNRKFSIFQYPTGNDIHWSWQNNDSDTTFIGGAVEGVLPTGVWTHVCFTYENPNMTLYINGVKTATRTGVSNSTFSNATTILYASSNRHMNDLRFYNHCLSQLEVRNLARGLVLQYNFGNSASNGLTTHYFNTTSSAYGFASVAIPAGVIKNGRTYTVSVCGKTNYTGGTKDYYLRTYVYDSNWAYQTIAWDTKSETETITKYTFTAGSNAEAYTYYITSYLFPSGGSSSGNSAYVRWYKIEEGPTNTPYRSSPTSTTIIDSNGNIHNGTHTNCLYTTDSTHGAVSLATSNKNGQGYVKIPSLYLENTFTICGWVKFSEFTTWARVFDFGTATEGGGYSIGLAVSDTAGTMTLFGRCGNSSISLPDTAMTSAALNTWYHFAITVAGTNLKFYWNGVLLKTVTLNGAIGNRTYTLNYLAKSNWAADGYCRKLFNDFRIYNTELSGNDISEIYNIKALFDNKNNLFTGSVQTDPSSEAFSVSLGGNSTKVADGVYRIVKSAEWDGVSTVPANIESGTNYRLSFDIQKESGTLNEMRGHLNNMSTVEYYVDGKKYSGSNWANYGENHGINDMKVHHYDVILTATAATEVYPYIQPNRGVTTSATVIVSNIKFDVDRNSTSNPDFGSKKAVNSCSRIITNTGNVEFFKRGMIAANNIYEGMGASVSPVVSYRPQWRTIFSGTAKKSWGDGDSYSVAMESPVDFVSLDYPTRITVTIDWDYMNVGNTDSSDTYTVVIPGKVISYYWAPASVNFTAIRRYGVNGVFKPFFDTTRTDDNSVGVFPGSVTFHTIEQFF